jgi:arylsulfatase A-like enzyme
MVPPQEGTTLEGPDKWAQGNIDRMNETQRAAWSETFDADNDSFIKSDLKGAELTRWKYQRYMQNYLRCIKGIDDNVGRLLDYLEENDLDDNTIIVYMSDQGFFLGEHGWYDKRFMYEPSLRIPLLISGPEITDKGSHSDLLVQNLDLAPTLLDLAGVEIPKRMQGQSMSPILKGDTTAWRDSIYYHYYEYPGAHAVQKHEGVRTERYKLIHYYEIDEWEMFDFKSDPNEMINLYDNPAYAGIQNELNQELSVLKVQYEVPSNQGL